jgi:hypothetical protein
MIFSYKAKQSQQVTALTRGGNEKARDTLNNVSEGKDINEIEGALQVGVEEGKGSKIYYENESGNDKETIGFNDKTSGESYINGATEYQNEEGKKVSAVTDTNELIKVDAHEQSHKYTENETIANIAGSEAKSAWAITNWIYGDSINTSGTATSTSWLSQQMNNTSSLGTLINNTVNAGKVAEENRLEKIKITGEDKFKQQTLDLLGKLTRDKLSLKEDGTVLITNLDNKSDKKNSGTELIRELNKKYETTKQEIDKNNVEIVYLENGKNTSEGAYDGNAGMTKGLGTSSFVQYNPDFDYTSLLNDSHLVKDNGITSAQTALSHELIHSYHDKLGTTEPRGSEKVPGYENQTVGLGNFKNNKITENTIRKEQGENERTKYS